MVYHIANLMNTKFIKLRVLKISSKLVIAKLKYIMIPNTSLKFGLQNESFFGWYNSRHNI